jgi:hypothetical protein
MTEASAVTQRVRYDDAVAKFELDHAITQLVGNPDTGLNGCVECCDRYVGENRIALRAISADGQLTELTFEELRDLSAKVGNVLKDAGVSAGDVVAGLLHRTPELIATILGAWRIGAVYQPLFTAFGPKAIDHRLKTSDAKLVVTNLANRSKLDEVENCPQVATILAPGETAPAGDIDFRAALAAASSDCPPVMRKGDDLFMMMSTSGTAGLPKGVPVPLFALLAFGAYMREAVGLRSDDIFWNIADPGWAYGLYYAVTGPLQLGLATTLYEGGFNAESTYDIIERLGVTSLAGSPTAFRLLMAAGPEAAARIKGRLRVVSSAGEPLNPEVIRWFDARPNSAWWSTTITALNIQFVRVQQVMPCRAIASLFWMKPEMNSAPTSQVSCPSTLQNRHYSGFPATTNRKHQPLRAAIIAPAIQWNSKTTVPSASLAVPMMSSPHPVIALDRSTWKAPCLSTRRSTRRQSSAFPIRSARKSSRHSSFSHRAMRARQHLPKSSRSM